MCALQQYLICLCVLIVTIIVKRNELVMRRQKMSPFKNFFVAMLTAVLLVGCDISIPSGKPDPQPEMQTRILEIKIDPNPVAPGDSVQFICIIEDSLDENFDFRWGLDGRNSVTTNKNIYKTKAPSESGIYHGRVEADNGNADELSPNKGFSFEVRQN